MSGCSCRVRIGDCFVDSDCDTATAHIEEQKKVSYYWPCERGAGLFRLS